MIPRDFLNCLRDGTNIPAQNIYDFAAALGGEDVSDSQLGAFAMAVCLQGLPISSRVALTEGMRDSGTVMHWQTDKKIIDKHSTGGVGDAVSLLLAPLLAAVGVAVPMISGRGLGHSGGTLDKLESISGFKTNLPLPMFRHAVAEVGCAIVAATSDICPADHRLYAVRDVTGTVRSTDLITASILSKKMAAGIQTLVLDVKVGSGAFMRDMDAAKHLATSLVRVANRAGFPTTALITDMNQPLVSAVGNAVEVAAVMHAFDTQSGRLIDVALELGVAVLKAAGVYYTEQGARKALVQALTDGTAKVKFGEMIFAQGGCENFLETWQSSLKIAGGHGVLAPSSGFVTAIDGVALGGIVSKIGGGRQVESDLIDHSVGLSQIVDLGCEIQAGQPLAILHADNNCAVSSIADAFTISDTAFDIPPLVYEKITS